MERWRKPSARVELAPMMTVRGCLCDGQWASVLASCHRPLTVTDQWARSRKVSADERGCAGGVDDHSEGGPERVEGGPGQIASTSRVLLRNEPASQIAAVLPLTRSTAAAAATRPAARVGIVVCLASWPPVVPPGAPGGHHRQTARPV